MGFVPKKSQPKVKAHAVEISDRRKRVVELMAQGLPQVKIAEILGIGLVTLAKDYKAVLEELAAYRMEIGKLVLDEQLQRLEYLWEKLQAGMSSGDTVEYVNSSLRVLEAKNKLLGIEQRSTAPETQITINYNGISMSDKDMITIQRERNPQLPAGDVEEGVIVRKKPRDKITRVSTWNLILHSEIIFWTTRERDLDNW